MNKSTTDLFQTKHSQKGIVLVAHGLNLNPSKMNSICFFLNQNGYSCLRLKLKGHFGDPESFINLSPQDWPNNFQEAYLEADLYAQSNNIPLFFLGYSLGGLLGVHFMLKNTHHIKKSILLSPAIALRWYTKTLRLTPYLPKKILLPSLGLREYRYHTGTSIAAYQCLQELYLNFQMDRQNLKTKTPSTKVFIHPRDELISYHKIKTLILSNHLDHWSLSTIKKRTPEKLRTPAHLIVDSQSLGKKEWPNLCSDILSFIGA